MICITGGKLAEEVLELLPDYSLVAVVLGTTTEIQWALGSHSVKSSLPSTPCLSPVCRLSSAPQVGFMICITGGKLAEEVLELLPDYSLSFMGEDGPGGAAAEDSGVELDRGCAYYSSEGVQQLNAQYGDLQHRIQDLEVRP